jgi:hypothetical protein
MITIAGQKTLLSELVQTIKTDPQLKWQKSFDCYLVKMDGRVFATVADVMTTLAGYVAGEAERTNVQLERYRGPGSTMNSAMTLAPLARARVHKDDVAAIASLLTTGDVGNGISNKSTHMSDPETGKTKSGAVTVSEYYVNGKEGRRATKRSEGMRISYYYSDSHTAATYKYARLI